MAHSKKNVARRTFFKTLAAGGMGTAFLPHIAAESASGVQEPEGKPKTNIEDSRKYPRNEWSMPGRYPGEVVRINHEHCIKENAPDPEVVYKMVHDGMLALTGQKNIKKAWREFVSPKDRIGLKINPVAGKSLSTSPEIVQVVIDQLIESGIPKSNLLIWDRREFQMHETGFTSEHFPDIKIIGTEQKDENGSFYNQDGMLYGEEMIDKDWYYWADVEGEYDEYTMPMMVNGGTYSYFSKICTQMVDKIINIPILKNAGPTVTLCLKNLAYGTVSNTGRLHKNLWAETTAEVNAFPPLRDKVVLNIVDGMKGCYNGGPGANPQFFVNYNTMLFGTDPVAVDRVGHDIVVKMRIEKGLVKEDNARARTFLDLAAKLELGEADLEKINLKEVNLG